MSFLADDDNDGILKYNKIWKKLTSYLVLNLIVSLFMMKNTLKKKKKLLKTKLLQNLQTMKLQKKILIIHVLLQFLLIL